MAGGTYSGDLIAIGPGGMSIGASTAISFTSPSGLGDYRLFSGNFGSPTLANFLLPPSGVDTYSLSTTADTGYLDLVVASAATFSGSATWVSNGSNPAWSNSGNWSDGTNHGVPGTTLSRTTDTATFSGSDAAPAITLDVPVSLAALSFSTSNYTLSGTNPLTMNAGSGTATVTVSSGTQMIASGLQIAGGNLVIAASNGGVLSISGDISEDHAGGRALTLSGDGSGQLILSGTNSYTGGTYVDQGTLYVQNSGAIQDSSTLTVGAGGVFIFDPTVTGTALSSLRPAGGVAPVPEPGTLVLLAAAGIVAAAAWRRRTS